MLQSHDWVLFRNVTYSIVQELIYIAYETDQGVFVRKEMAIAITYNIKSKIKKNNLAT